MKTQIYSDIFQNYKHAIDQKIESGNFEFLIFKIK